MNSIYADIQESIQSGKKLLAVLIDPDKTKPAAIKKLSYKINKSPATYIFVGGSEVAESLTEILIIEIKKHTQIPIVIFPGAITQITSEAHALLFLSLLSGRNPEYLIGQHVKAISKIRETPLEIISTGYLLIENGVKTAVQRVTETKPLANNKIQTIVDTAKAGEYLGMKCIYLEAGSGAIQPVSSKIVSAVKKDIQIPLIVGGGIKTLKQIQVAYNAGADLVVIGTAFENDDTFFEKRTI